MKKAKNKRKTTTLSCDVPTREFIAAEAQRTGLLQREVLVRMLDAYKQLYVSKVKKTQPGILESPGRIDPEDLNNALSCVVTKEVNRIIGFVLKQEEIYLKPISDLVSKNNVLTKQLINELQDFNNPQEF